MLLWTEAVLLGPITHCSCWTQGQRRYHFSKNQSLLQRTTICPTWKYSQKYTMGSVDNLIKRIPEMFGAITTSMEASKDYIYPKVTTLKRVKSIYTVNLIFWKVSSSDQCHSSPDCQCHLTWESTHHTARSYAGASIINNTTSSQRACHSTQSSRSGCELLQILAASRGGIYLGILHRKWKSC